MWLYILYAYCICLSLRSGKLIKGTTHSTATICTFDVYKDMVRIYAIKFTLHAQNMFKYIVLCSISYITYSTTKCH